MKYRLSSYSLPFELEDCKFFFSTGSKSLVKVAPALWRSLKSGNYFTEVGVNSNPLIKKLADAAIITTDEEDEGFYNKLKLQYLTKSFQSSHLSLTILPTQACNLCCPYCFEGDKQPLSMSDDVQEALVKYVSSQPIKTYSVTWFGGEPLLRPDIINALLEKLSLIPGVRITYHNIITNGTFLTQKVFPIFRKFPLDSLQVTLDGKKETHDKLRCDRAGIGSFDLIKRNLMEFISEFPETHISIRVNITKANASDFTEIHAEVSKWFDGKNSNYNVYPGIIKEVEGNIVESGCLNRGEQQEFYLDLYSKGLRYHRFPKNEMGGCTATTSSSLVVGANGYLYKCWEDVGKEDMTVGSIMDTNMGQDNVLADYLIKGTKFSDEECKHCGYLPICSGGCPKDRVKLHIIKPHQCSLYSINEGKLLKTVMREYIQQKKFQD